MKSGYHVRFQKIFSLCGVVLLSRRSFLHRHRATRRSAVFFAADTDNNRAFMADSIFERRKIIFASAFAEFINWVCVVRGVPAILYVDISAAMVHVANLLRFCGRHGDFYFFIERDDTFTLAADNLRFEFIFFADTACRIDLLLHDVALFIAGVAHGDLFDELARGMRIFTRHDRNTKFIDNLRGDRIFFAAFL